MAMGWTSWAPIGSVRGISSVIGISWKDPSPIVVMPSRDASSATLSSPTV